MWKLKLSDMKRSLGIVTKFCESFKVFSKNCNKAVLWRLKLSGMQHSAGIDTKLLYEGLNWEVQSIQQEL